MWLRVDDKFPDHPKVRGLDAMALAVWLCAACWSAEYEQNGKVPLQVARQLAARFDLQESLLTGEPPVVSRLVAVELWERIDIGYMVHDFLEYNPSKSDLDKRRKRERLRRRKGYQDSVSARRRVARNVLPTTPHVASTRTRPVPVLLPVPKEIKTPPPAPPLGEPRRRVKNRTALQMAQDATTTALGEASVRLVTAASERFSWTLTKTRLAEEWRLAGELLEHWDEATILRAIAQRRKLGSMRWLADFVPQMLRGESAPPTAAPPKERAWLDDVDSPEPDLTPEQLAANQARIREMVTTALGHMPR